MKKAFSIQTRLYWTLHGYLNGQGPGHQADFLAKEYKKLWSLFSGVPTREFKLKTQKFVPGGEFKKLAAFAQKELAPYIRYFFIHGSAGTKDFVPGFSDIDTYVFIKKNVCESPKLLRELREKFLKGREILKKIDPTIHHGFICGSEANLKYYANPYMPVSVFEDARRLVGPGEITFNLRDSRVEAADTFSRYARMFYDAARTGVLKARAGRGHLYQFKYFLSAVFLMPSLFLQAQGVYTGKKDSFSLVKHPFLARTSRVRNNFPKKLVNPISKNYFVGAARMVRQMTDRLSAAKRAGYENTPRALPPKIYKQALKEIITHYSQNKDILSVYDYGTADPICGVSDLDLIVVTKDALKNSSAKDYRLNTSDFKKARRLPPATIMLMPESIFENINGFDDKITIKKLWGKSVRTHDIARPLKEPRKTAAVIDWLPERTAQLIRMYVKNKIDVVYSLRLLGSISVPINTVNKLKPRFLYEDFLREVADTRRNWFSLKDKNLKELIKKGIYTGFIAMADFANIKLAKEKGREGEVYLQKTTKLVFVKDTSKIAPDQVVEDAQKGTVKLPLDARFAPHFYFYSRRPGLLANEMKKGAQFKNSVRPRSSEYKKFLARKMALAAAHAEFLVHNNLKTNPFRFGFYLKNND